MRKRSYNGKRLTDTKGNTYTVTHTYYGQPGFVELTLDAMRAVTIPRYLAASWAEGSIKVQVAR